jgi:hypothetical protein
MSISKVKYEYKPLGYSEQHFQDPLISYSVTVGVEYLERKNYSLASEILFYQSGGKESEEDLNNYHLVNTSGKAVLSYMSFGTYINFNPIDKAFKLQIQCGPRIDYVIGGLNAGSYRWIDINEELSRFNFGFTLGVGTYYNVKQFVVGVKAQYLNKFKKVADFDPESPENNFAIMGAEVSEQVFLVSFSIGYKFSSRGDRKESQKE